MNRPTSVFATIGTLVGIAAIAAANPVSEVTSRDGGASPQQVTWDRAEPVNQHLFPSAGSAVPRGGVEFLDVNNYPEGDMPRDVTFTADGTAAVIANRDTDNITFFDVATQTITDTVAVGDFPVHVAVTPDNRYAVIPNVFSNDVSVVDIATRTLVATIPITGEQPYHVALTSDSGFAVVGVINDAENSSFSIIDLNTLSETSTIPTVSQGVFGFFFTPEPGISGNMFTKFGLSPDGTTIVLPDRGNAQVAIYDRVTGAELALLATADLPTAVDISSDSTLAVVSHEGSAQRISTIDLTTLTVTNSFSTGDGLQSQVIRLTPDNSHAIAAISNNTIFTNLTTGARTATISTGVVGDIEISHDGQYAFVSNYNARLISIASQSLIRTMTFAACVDSAVSPTELRAVALNNRFRENIHLYNINGSSASFEGFAASGEPPEGDSPRDLAISADGRVAIACNNISANACIIDMTTRTVRSYVDVGDRPLDAAITPDGAYGVVCGADGNNVAIIDLSTDTVVKNLSIVRRPSRIRISPDGQFAYVLNIASGDKVTFIQLDGAASSIIAQASAGETGSVGTNISGIELSHDGSILAVCASFDDNLNLFDTATQTRIASVPVGDFPLRVAFSPDDSLAYVTNVFDDNVSVVEIDGASSHQIATVGGIDYPLTIDVDADGSYVYVGNSSSGAGIRVIDTATNSIVRTITFADGSPRTTYLSPTDGTLYVSSSASEVLRISATGPTSAIIDTTPISSSASHMVFDNWLGVAVCGQPTLDGLDFVQFGCVADLDADRDIDLADLAALLANYGTTAGATREEGDLDGDGDVDLADLAELLAAYGTTCG